MRAFFTFFGGIGLFAKKIVLLLRLRRAEQAKDYKAARDLCAQIARLERN